MANALRLLVLNHLAHRHLDVLTNAMPHISIQTATLETAAEFAATTDVLAAWGNMDIRPFYLTAPNLKWIHALSAGVEKLTFPEIQDSSVILTNSKGIHGIPVSEHVLSLMLTFSRGLNLLLRQQQQHVWKRVPTDEIYEKTIGIVGLGSIGRAIAKKSKALGMTVLATKREITSEIFVDKLFAPTQMAEMLAASDYVVVALPLTEETNEMFGMEYFRHMKKSAYFINIARGSVVDEKALIAALEEGLIRGAGLDVFEEEPLASDSPLWDMPNVIITPHLAAISPYYMDRAVKLLADNLCRFIQGGEGEMVNVIDKRKGY